MSGFRQTYWLPRKKAPFGDYVGRGVREGVKEIESHCRNAEILTPDGQTGFADANKRVR